MIIWSLVLVGWVILYNTGGAAIQKDLTLVCKNVGLGSMDLAWGSDKISLKSDWLSADPQEFHTSMSLALYGIIYT